MSSPKGYSSQEKDDRLSAQFSTVEPVRELQNGLSVVAHQFVTQVATDSAEAGSSASQLIASAHLAKKGDVIQFTSGTFSGRQVKVWDVATDSITLAETLPSAVASGVTFTILRHKYPQVDSSGAVSITGSISFAEEATAADGGALPALVKVVAGYDGANVQALATDSSGNLQVDVLTNVLPTGAATSAAQTDGSQKSQIVDATGEIVEVKALNVALAGTDKGLVTNSVIHGETTGGGGGYVDVKVTPSGALVTDSTISGLDAAILGQDTMANSLPVVIASNQTAVPVSGSVSVSNFPATQAVTGPLTDAQLRAAAVPVSMASSPLPLGAATETTLDLIADTTNANSSTLTAGRLIVPGFPDGLNTVRPVQLDGDFRVKVGATLVDSAGINKAAISAAGAVRVDGSAVTQPVSGTVGVSGSVAVTGPLTDSQLRATAVPVSAAALPLPAGAATETTLSALNGKVPANLTVTATRLLVDGSGVTQPISAAALPLPSGAATETTLSAINTKTPALGQAAMAASSPVVIASNQTAVPIVEGGRSIVARARNVYNTTNVTTGAYVQLVASLGSAVNSVEIFDSSGQTLVLATGGAGSEVDQAFVFPGGNGRIPLAIAAATRISIRAVSATANDGEIAINFYS